MKTRRDAMLGAFIGDALSLGPHWIYDTDKIFDVFGEIKGITSPLKDSFHKTKNKGEFTHYGDQMLMLLEYYHEKQLNFNKEDFLKKFYDWTQNYTGYMDKATKDTISNIEKGNYIGSNSEELAGILSIPVMYFLSENYKKDSIERTKATHNNELVLSIVDFTLELLELIEEGYSISEGIDKLKCFQPPNLRKLIEMAINSLSRDTITVIKEFGQMCNAKNAFPSSIYLILKYEYDFKKALLKNVQAGGDSAARGIMVGTILGAFHGIDVLPKKWLSDISHFDNIRLYE